MSETSPFKEVPQVRKEQVTGAFKKFLDRGFTSPDELPLDDPEVMEANDILDVWTKQEQEKAEAKGTIEADLQFNLDRSTIFIDAGFSDPNYLDEVANDWLLQNLQEAEEANLPEMVSKIQAKIDEINKTIPNP